MQNEAYFTRSRINDPKVYGRLRAERLKIRVDAEKLDAQMKGDANFSHEEKSARIAQRAALSAREKRTCRPHGRSFDFSGSAR